MTDTIQTFDTTVDVLRASLWQYQNAERIQSLLASKNAWYLANQTEFWDDWYSDVFDLRTANPFGLMVWSIILGQPIIFPNVGNPDQPTWGFGEFHRNFTRGNFASSSGFTYRLSPETARIVLRLRYYHLTGTCCVPDVNRMLADVFADYGPAWLLDNNDMTQLYIFTFALPADLRFVFNNYDILPRPAGVGTDYRVTVEETWGFGEYHENFDNGNFSEL